MKKERPYRSPKRREKASLTRAAVLSAASEAFGSYGYAGTTMRAVALAAGVSVPTVEQHFGTKANLLKACIDVAIVGDNEPLGALERDWTQEARAATDLPQIASILAKVIGPAQTRSAALVLAAFEGAGNDSDLAALSVSLSAQRKQTARWIVEQLVRIEPLRAGLNPSDAIETVWLLMDPTVFERLTQRLGRSVTHYQRWIADSLIRLLFDITTQQTPKRRLR